MSARYQRFVLLADSVANMILDSSNPEATGREADTRLAAFLMENKSALRAFFALPLESALKTGRGTIDDIKASTVCVYSPVCGADSRVSPERKVVMELLLIGEEQLYFAAELRWGLNCCRKASRGEMSRRLKYFRSALDVKSRLDLMPCPTSYVVEWDQLCSLIAMLKGLFPALQIA